MPPKLLKATPRDIRSLGLDERWVQDRIAEDPIQLGLGDVYLKDKERFQPRAGRLDLLFQDTEEPRRYEVELQLGATDECHIIRTIEYWDIERKRYPQYEHTAVLIAENVTARFLNVISLFNGQIPLVAIQMQALEVFDGVVLVFTKVLDALAQGLVEEDEGTTVQADRKYWEQRAAPTIALVDRLFTIAATIAPNVEMNYLRGYVGTKLNGKVQNFFWTEPKKTHVRVGLRLPYSASTDEALTKAGLEFKYYSWGAYKVWLTPEGVDKNEELVGSLLKSAYQHFCS